MAIPVKYQRSPDPAIASYDYVDLAEGTGIVALYLYSSIVVSDVNDYHLGRTAVYSADTTLDKTHTDIDYDLSPFSTPRDIKGTGFINIPYNLGDGESGYLTCKVRKWDGTNETEIASVVTNTASGASVGIFSVPITIPLTHFKIGETLRFTVGLTVVGGTAAFDYGIQPMNLTSGTMITTTSKFFCPFLLNN